MAIRAIQRNAASGNRCDAPDAVEPAVGSLGYGTFDLFVPPKLDDSVDREIQKGFAKPSLMPASSPLHGPGNHRCDRERSDPSDPSP